MSLPKYVPGDIVLTDTRMGKIVNALWDVGQVWKYELELPQGGGYRMQIKEPEIVAVYNLDSQRWEQPNE